jgi:NAD(P)-dependent dehydrogenase (short-subunit alcohol dehydrogenase family)
MVDIQANGLIETVSLARKSNVSKHIINITDCASVEALPNLVIEHHSAIDGLINNAGIIHPFVEIKDLDYGAIERVFNINFL